MKLQYSHTRIPTLLLGMLLAACSSEEKATDNAVEHPNGAIELQAGIVEGGSTVTRAGTAESHHDATATYGGHQTLTTNTALVLRVSGTWTGHTPVNVVKTTEATVGAETTSGDPATGTKHNSVSCSPTLYWDDYGSAAEGNFDPDNKTATANAGNTITYGRGVGLTIYGAAVNGKTTTQDAGVNGLMDANADWTAFSWTLAANQTSSGNTPADKDLLISNNVQPSSGASTSNDGTYKFDERSSGKLLEFRHALSKITVNLKPGEGFNGAFTSTEVTLTSNEAGQSNTEWAYTTGTVNITTGGVTSQANPAAITMADATLSTAASADDYTVAKEALVMPGSQFAGKTSDAVDAPYHVIARINADGNIYYVSSEMIRKAINGTESEYASITPFATEAGKNYVINVLVNKTSINVTATVADWTTVKAAEEAPKINITVGYGFPGTAVRVNTFSFYRSLNLNDGYASESENMKFNGYYKRVSELKRVSTNPDKWEMTPKRYWSNHNQHYQFRLVWPNTTTAKKWPKDQTTVQDPDWLEYVQRWRPHVEDKEYKGTNYQVIEIWNDKYQAIDPAKTDIANDYHPYPSNLAIARPEPTTADDPKTTEIDESDPLCTNNEPGHERKHIYSEGICATEGEIDLNFCFIMSQVEVRLATTPSTSASKVRLTNAKVELVNVDTLGYVKLGDREVINSGTKLTDSLDYVKTVTGGPSDTLYFHSAIVPQELTSQASGNLRFKITITNDDDDHTTDVYYADVEPIKEKDKSTKVAPNGKWESGVHYIYYLTVSKTEIKLTATLAQWTTVEAEEEVWF